MKRILHILFINIAIFCMLIVGLELFGQLAYLIKHGSFLPIDVPRRNKSIQPKIFELHPFLVGRPKKNIFVNQENKSITITDIHTRWTGAPKDDSELIRIAILGGSTAFGTGVTDQDSWAALLQKKLGNRFSVINYGVPGYSSAEAIIQMALIVPEKKPHFIIFFEGWNDIRNYHETDLGADYLSHGLRQYYNLQIPLAQELTIFQKLDELSSIFRFANQIKDSISPKPAKEEEKVTIYETPDPFVDRIYVRNLHTLKNLAEGIGAFSIFIPQVLNYKNFVNKPGSMRWSRHIKNSALQSLMSRFNSLMHEVCHKGELRCTVLSEVLIQNWGDEDFVEKPDGSIDNGHFSKAGGEKFTEIIRLFIYDNLNLQHQE